MAKLRKIAKKGRRPYKRRAGTRKRAVKSVVNITKQVVTRMAEKKIANSYVSSLPITNYNVGAYGGSTFTFQTIQLTPNTLTMSISQGNGQQNRLGNRITTKYLNFRGMLTARPYSTAAPANTDPRPSLVKMWIMYDKSAATGYVNPAGLNFFQSGSSTAAPTGTNIDTFLQVNRDRYVVVAQKLFKVGLSGYSGGTTAMGTPSYYAYWHNNDFKYAQYFNFNLTKYIPKNIIFNDTSGDPMTRGLWCVLEALNVDGVGMTASSYPVALTYELNYSYTDI